MDTPIDLARRSSLDGVELGRVVSQLLATSAVIGTRVAQTMADAGRAEPCGGFCSVARSVVRLAAVADAAPSIPRSRPYWVREGASVTFRWCRADLNLVLRSWVEDGEQVPRIVKAVDQVPMWNVVGRVVIPAN